MRVGTLVKCEDKLALVVQVRLNRGVELVCKVQFVHNGKSVWYSTPSLQTFCKLKSTWTFYDRFQFDR